MKKLYEEVQKGPLSTLIVHYKTTPARGEIVVVIDGASSQKAALPEYFGMYLQEALKTHSVKDAVELVSKVFGQPKREVYHHALTLKSKDTSLS